MENLGIDPKLLIAQVVNFGLFFFLFKKFLAKPFAEFVSGEKAKDLEKDRALLKAKKLEEDAIKKEQAIEAKAKKESSVIIAEAKKNADRMKEEILETAREEAKEIKEKSKKQLEVERESLYGQIKDKVTKLSFVVINDALKQSLPEEARKKITEQILKNSKKQTVS